MDYKPSQNVQHPGSFLNGRAQIIELLQHLNVDEKSKLLKNLRLKNPQLASELSKESFSFLQIERLPDEQINILFRYISPQIMGVGLKATPSSLQRKILGLAPRDYAEEAYSIMISPIKDEKEGRKRAQNKILGTLLEIYNR